MAAIVARLLTKVPSMVESLAGKSAGKLGTEAAAGATAEKAGKGVLASIFSGKNMMIAGGTTAASMGLMSMLNNRSSQTQAAQNAAAGKNIYSATPSGTTAGASGTQASAQPNNNQQVFAKLGGEADSSLASVGPAVKNADSHIKSFFSNIGSMFGF